MNAKKRWSIFILLAGLGVMSLAPYGSCSCRQENPLSDPTITTGAPVPLPTPTPLPLIDNFEDGDDQTEQGQSILTSVDGYGSTLAPVPWLPRVGGSTLPGGTSGYSGCINGTIVLDGPPNYPYTQLLHTISNPVPLATWAPNNRIRVSYRFMPTMAPPATLRFNFIEVAVPPVVIADYGWYSVDIPMTDTNWHEAVLCFPGTSGFPCTATFAQPAWAASVPWSPNFTDVMAGFVLQCLPRVGVSTNFDICIDDITFE